MNEIGLLSHEAQEGFYPTPPDLAKRMLAKVSWDGVCRVIEPSAGKGDLVDTLLEEAYEKHRYQSKPKIDCVEIDPVLRETLVNKVSTKKANILKEIKSLEDKGYDGRTEQEGNKLASLRSKESYLSKCEVHVVHDDFLTYHTYTAYQLCIMNPPFANGDAHLLRAMGIMQKSGGQIVCLLNAETIRNPYTNLRKSLMKKLDEYNADIEYTEGAFVKAERKTSVDVAIVYVKIPAEEHDSEFYTRMKQAADRKIEADPELKALVAGDYLEQAVQMYRVEVEATTKFVEEYYALRPYIASSLTGKGSSPLLSLAVQEYGNSYFGYNHDSYMEAVRLKYWAALLHNDKFVGKLTTNLREQYQAEIDRMKDYEFSMFNIKQVYMEMQCSMANGIEDAILNLFDTMTVKYAHWKDCTETVWLYDGWKTNKAHKIGKRVILPVNAYSFSWFGREKEFEVNKAYDVLSDIEKTLDYLSANPVNEGYSLRERLVSAKEAKKFKNVPLKYFNVDFFKIKGTMHIKFLPDAMPLVERLNIFGSQHHGWLPPDYGKKSYSKMSKEEKHVVDSFHGNGTDGSGQSKYEEVLHEASYYLASPVQKLPALMASS